MKFLKDIKVRGYIYRVACAVGLALVAEGLITEQEFRLYEGVAVAVLALASVNTSVKDD